MTANDGAGTPDGIRLRTVAASTLVVLGITAAAAVTYLLIDVLLLLFIGVVVAAALQPWHAVLCAWRIPRGAAVLLIYLFLIVCLCVIALLVGPALADQIGTFAGDLPRSYGEFLAWLQAHDLAPLQMLGQRLPSLERLTPGLTEIAPLLFQGTLGVTAGIVKLPIYFMTILAIAFYWTMEVPHFERLLLSMVAVERRPAALGVWHEIESKLGGYLRGQGLAMLFMGTASGIAYALIGLPNALVLGVLAGVLEAVPFIGPVVAVGPAILVAIPLGMDSVALVIGFAVLLHLFESDVLIPRIMSHTVGVSALVSLLALLAFATLYGILGVLIAIPIAAVVQVLLDTFVLDRRSVAASAAAVGAQPADLRVRVQALQQHARDRLRARTNRMGIDPSTADHVVDAVDQQVEAALASIERLLATAEFEARPLTPQEQAAFAEKLQAAALQIEQAVEQVDGFVAPIAETTAGELERALQRFRTTVQEVEGMILAAQRTKATG